MLDILFEHRNKAYGAYELRRNYALRARKALTGILVFSIVLASVPLLAGLVNVQPVHHPPTFSDSLLIHTYEPPAELPEPIPEPKPVTPPEETNQPAIPVEIVIAVDVPDPKPQDPAVVQPSGLEGGEGPTTSSAGDHPGGKDKDGGDDHPQEGIIPDPEKTYESFDIAQAPEFPGGEEALMQYLTANVHYPAPALNNNIQGKVTIGFVVNKDGQIEDVRVLRGLGYGCDEEAMRVISKMPNWKPGKNNGRPVNVYFNVPLVFELRE